MNSKPVIIFVCEHGAAKSVVAATHFNKLAGERNLSLRAIARGTTPDEKLSSKAVEGLKSDGVIPTESVPQKLSLVDIRPADRIITFCELPEEYHSKAAVEHWDDIPPVSEGYENARDAIVEKVRQLIDEIS